MRIYRIKLTELKKLLKEQRLSKEQQAAFQVKIKDPFVRKTIKFLRQHGYKIEERDVNEFIVDDLAVLFLEEYKTATKWKLSWNAMADYSKLERHSGWKFNPKNYSSEEDVEYGRRNKLYQPEVTAWKMAGKILQELKDSGLKEKITPRVWQI